jgi:hypothetical protein
MKKMVFRLTALIAVMMMTTAASADVNDSLSMDTTLWYNQTQQLGGIVVKGRLPKTRVKGDAMRTTVAGTILEKAGTLSDALSRIPSLETKSEGGVKVMGRGEAEIYINGRRVQDVSELARISSDQVQHVDVVHNPGARYKASTKAVVRITLKKAQGEGFSFQEKAQGMYQYGWSANNLLDVNYRTGGLDLTASFWAGSYAHNKSLQEDDITYYVGEQKEDEIFGHSVQETRHKWKGLLPQLQINYMIDQNHSLGAFYKYDYHPNGTLTSQFNTDEYENGKFIERSESEVWQDEKFKKHIFNAYYNGKVGNLSIDLNIDGLFDKTETPGNTRELAWADGAKTGTSAVRNIESNTKSSNNFWASKLIFSYPLLKGNLSVGGEYSYNHRTDAYSFEASEAVPVTTTDTEINESSAAGFVEYGRQFGKVFVQAGLRYEHLKNDYYNFGKRDDEVCRNYGDWFPTLVISAPIGKVQTSLSYRQDIQRPAYGNLTSSTIYLNRYAYQSGNPYLKPTYTNSLVLNVGYKWMGVNINYSQVKNSETMSTEPYPGADDPLICLVRPINTEEDYQQLSFNPYASPTINFQLSTFNCSWHPTWYVYLLFQNYKAPTAKGTIITLDHSYLNTGWDNTIELPKSWRINASLRYSTKGDVGNCRLLKAQGRLDLGIQHDINLRRMGQLTLDMRCNDLFSTDETKATLYGPRELTVLNPTRRTFILNLTWKFNEAHSKYRGSGAGEKQKARM